jgi:hypothetical protein
MNAFSWQGQPSAISIKQPSSVRVSLAPKRFHEYQEATVSDTTREAEITQTNAEIERHFALAQEACLSDKERAIHRDYARQLAAKARALIMGRSAGFIAKLEQQRGLA